jgi:hypothetical protein
VIALVWSLIVFSILLNLASFAWDLYEVVWWYDKAVHVLTTFAFTLPLPLLLYNRVLRGLHRQRILLVVVIMCLGLALGALWEIFEWGASQAWGGPNLKEKRLDVVTDLAVDGVGALLGAWVGVVLLRQTRA